LNHLASSRQGWSYLISLAENSNRDLRQVSLIRAYSWVEHALSALGLKRGRSPVARLLFKALNNGYFPSSLKYHNVQKAINTRHKAAHIDTVPDPKNCIEAVNILSEIWNHCRKNFVNIETAKRLSKELLQQEGVLKVFIFGSLARSHYYPNDIDFLIYDDGRFSKKIEPKFRQYLDRAKLTRNVLKLMNLLIHPYVHIANCRWMDISIVNGILFGKDNEYTRSISSCQSDPYFFLNIAQDIKEFHIDKFQKADEDIFNLLREIKELYTKSGF